MAPQAYIYIYTYIYMYVYMYMYMYIFVRTYIERERRESANQQSPKEGSSWAVPLFPLCVYACHTFAFSEGMNNIRKTPHLESHPCATSGMLSVNSPALILSKNSGVFLPKIGSKSAKIGQNRLKIG